MGFYIRCRADEVANWFWILTLDVLVNNLGKACDLNKTAKTKSEGGKREIRQGNRRQSPPRSFISDSFKRETKKNGGEKKR